MKVDEILIIIIGLLILIILYKIYNGGLVEGAEEGDCQERLKKRCGKEAGGENCDKCIIDNAILGKDGGKRLDMVCSSQDYTEFCTYTPPPLPAAAAAAAAEASFCELDNAKQADLCLMQDKDSCSKYGEGCKWTSEQSAGLGMWGHPGIGNNTYPSCMVNCDACQRGKPAWDIKGCGTQYTKINCERLYGVPFIGNNKLCVWADPQPKSVSEWCLPDQHDRFCSVRRESKKCSDKDNDGYCYGTGHA